MIARLASAGALVAAIALVVLVVLGSGSTYTLRADFQDAGGLVPGDDVLVGPARVGSVKSVSLTDSGQAQIVLGLDPNEGPMHAGTIARIYQNSLSGIANRYVSLQLGPADAPTIKSGGLIPESDTYSTVNLDQVFDSLNPLTRAGLRGFIRGQAASIQGRALAAHRTLRYFAPGLESTSAVTAELTRDQPVFDALVVQGAQAMQALASRSQELAALIANGNATTAAIASQSQALQQALVLLPGTLSKGTATFAGVNSTLDALDPLVAASKVQDQQLTAFATSLRSVTVASIPTIGALSALIHNPSGAGDLTTLMLQTPGLERIVAVAFPRLIEAMNKSQSQLDYLRVFTPDVAAALANIGQVSAYYDADGHYVRTQPDTFAFAFNSATRQLVPQPAFARYAGLQVAHGRCPGGAMQPSPDGSAPWLVPGCQLTSTPPGP